MDKSKKKGYKAPKRYVLFTTTGDTFMAPVESTRDNPGTEASTRENLATEFEELERVSKQLAIRERELVHALEEGKVPVPPYNDQAQRLAALNEANQRNALRITQLIDLLKAKNIEIPKARHVLPKQEIQD